MAGKSTGRVQKILSVLLYLWLAVCIFTQFLPGTWLTHNLFCYPPPMLLVVPAFLFGVGILIRVVLRKANRLDLINLGIGTFASLMILGIQIPLPTSMPEGQSIHVLTTNVEFHNRDVPGLHEFIEAHKVDVVLMQEVKGGDKSPAAKIAREIPGWSLATAGEVAILSHWPLSNIQTTEQRATPGRFVLSCTVNAPKPFSAVAVHWTVPQISGGFKSLQGTLRNQTIDFEDTQTALAKLKLPIILGGDFNNPPRHTLSRQLSDQLTDAFSQRGFGFGWTFAAGSPMVRIDHLFTSPHIHPTKAEVGPSFGSDHLSLYGEFVME